MAFNSNELGVIRTYIAVTGNAPTQAELDAAFDNTGLNALATELVQNFPASSNAAFVESLYQNLLGRAADSDGLQYWSSLLTSAAGPNQLSKARLAVEFQNVAAMNAGSEAGFVDGTAGLTSVDGEFATPTGPEEPTEPTEITTEFVFDTSEGEANVKGWTHTESDETGQISAPGTPTSDTYMSQTHKIYNVGKEAIDKGVGTIANDYTFRTENQLGDHGHYEAYLLSPLLDNVTTNLGSVLTVEVIDRMAEANDKDAALSLVAIESFSFRLNGEQIEVGSQEILDAETYSELRNAIEARINELSADNAALNDVDVTLGGDFVRQQVDADTLLTTGANVLGTQIVLTATGSNLIERGGFTFGERSGVDRNVDPSGRQDTSVLGSETDLITTNLEFKNVGYGSQGGSVNVSGQSMSDRGVEQFDVTAEKNDLGLGVWLTELSSQPLKDRELNILEVINLTGDADYFHVGNEQTSAQNVDGGTVNAGKANAGITDVRVFNASDFGQNVRINAEVTSDVIARDLNLSDGQANPAGDNLTYNYDLGNGDNHLALSFSESVIAYEDVELNITTGSGNDRIVLTLDNDGSAAPINWYSNQKDQKNVVINTGSGNDVVETIGAGDAAILVGAGNDTVYTDNSGSQPDADKAIWVFNSENLEVADLLGGSGAPLAGTSGQTGPYFLYDTTLTVTFAGAGATPAGGLTGPVAAALANGFEASVKVPTGANYEATERHINQAIKTAINGNNVLNKFLQAIDGPNDTLIVRSLVDGEFVAGDLSVDLIAGTVPAASSSAFNQVQAAWEEFNGNSGLVDIVNADLGTQVSDLKDTTGQGGYEGLDAGNAVLGQAGATDLTGADSIVESNNVINLGTGQDVVVLGTGEDSNDMLVYTGYNNGVNSVLNFVQEADGVSGNSETGVDFINFTSYLTTQVTSSGSTSGSSVSADVVEFQASAGTFNGNTVSIIDFLGAGGNAQQTWDNLSGADLIALLNDPATVYGAAGNSAAFDAYDADNGQTAMGTAVPGAIVGNTNNHIFMVQNDNNDGQYKVFHVTSTRVDDADAGNFDTGAQLVGVVDLGNSLSTNAFDMDASLVGSAEWALTSGMA